MEQDGGHGAADPNRVRGGGLSRDGAGAWGPRWQRRDRRRGMAAEECVMNQELTPSIGNYGYGTYLTGFNNATVAALQGASATEVAIPVATEGLAVSPTYFPGTYIVRGAGVLLQ